MAYLDDEPKAVDSDAVIPASSAQLRTALAESATHSYRPPGAHIAGEQESRENEPKIEASVGCLVTFEHIEKGVKVIVYISKTERTIQELPSHVQEKLPTGTMVVPVDHPNQKVKKTLAGYLLGHKEGTVADLPSGGFHALLLEVTMVRQEAE